MPPEGCVAAEVEILWAGGGGGPGEQAALLRSCSDRGSALPRATLFSALPWAVLVFTLQPDSLRSVVEPGFTPTSRGACWSPPPRRPS